MSVIIFSLPHMSLVHERLPQVEKDAAVCAMASVTSCARCFVE
jgi:hypothetical protein